MKIQRFFIIILLLISFVLTNLSKVNAFSWNDFFSRAEKSFFSPVFEFTDSVMNYISKINFFGIEPVEIKLVNLGDGINVEDVPIGGSIDYNIRSEDLSDSTNFNSQDDDIINLISKTDNSETDVKKEIEDKISSIEENIKKVKADPSKADTEKKQEIAQLNNQLKALTDEKHELTSKEKDDIYFRNAIIDAQNGKVPRYSNQVLDQTGLRGSPDYYDGKFVCDINNNGVFSGRERPRNQGGQIANELFYAVANAAKSSGANVTLISGFRPGAVVAGTGNPSKHGIGEAVDVLLKGNDARNTAFMVIFLANTGNYNTVGSYASRNFDHTHLGSDCGATWCPYQRGAGLEPWKEIAFRVVFQACRQPFNPMARPSKQWIQKCAKDAIKDAIDTFCKPVGGNNSQRLTS